MTSLDCVGAAMNRIAWARGRSDPLYQQLKDFAVKLHTEFLKGGYDYVAAQMPEAPGGVHTLPNASLSKEAQTSFSHNVDASHCPQRGDDKSSQPSSIQLG